MEKKPGKLNYTRKKGESIPLINLPQPLLPRSHEMPPLTETHEFLSKKKRAAKRVEAAQRTLETKCVTVSTCTGKSEMKPTVSLRRVFFLDTNTSKEFVR